MPSDDLGGFGEHSFDFYLFNRVGGRWLIGGPYDLACWFDGQKRGRGRNEYGGFEKIIDVVNQTDKMTPADHHVA